VKLHLNRPSQNCTATIRIFY